MPRAVVAENFERTEAAEVNAPLLQLPAEAAHRTGPEIAPHRPQHPARRFGKSATKISQHRLPP
jgi:hypothetical protein